MKYGKVIDCNSCGTGVRDGCWMSIPSDAREALGFGHVEGTGNLVVHVCKPCRAQLQVAFDIHQIERALEMDDSWP